MVGLIAITCADCAFGAITLTVDRHAKTVTWSGTATTNIIPASAGSFVLTVGTSSSSSSGFFFDQSSGALAATSSELDVLPSAFAGQIIVHPPQPGFLNSVVAIVTLSPLHSGTVIVTANGIPYSYASEHPDIMTALESHDGTVLRFQPGSRNLGIAGSVIVVPSPSSSLGMLAFAAASTRKRRR